MIPFPILLVIDNYDSFTYNLVQMFKPFELDIRVHRADRISVVEAIDLSPRYLLISPGPKDPAHAGNSIDLIRSFYRKIPVLGVCLGMQCINEVFGGRTIRAPEPVHGKTSLVTHLGQYLFQDVPSPVKVARYHSLITTDISNELEITARSLDNIPMALSHAEYPLHGLQFHPESFLTEAGDIMIRNFLRLGPLHIP